MAGKIYLHRITHEGNVSYRLMELGYITIGWSKFSDSDILQAAREEGYPDFNHVAEMYGEGHNRSRWNMWYFAKMNVGDIIIVPLYGGNFSAFKVTEVAKSIGELENSVSEIVGVWNNHKMVWKNHQIYDEVDNRGIDIGFYITVKPIVKDVPRNYAAGKLVSRMKIRSTSADITDLERYVNLSIKAGINGKPVSLYELSIESLAKDLKKQIIEILNDSKFEKLIKWYVIKSGAEYSVIPAKNEPGKKDGADADIVAEFKNLKHIIYIQAKLHEGETSDWAVHQIKEYYNQKSDGDPDYSYARWVISTCDGYSEEAIRAAEEYRVRLINGEEFARMLIDIGLLNLDDAFL